MTSASLLERVVRLDNLAAARGMPTTERVWSLLLAALAITDREVNHGIPRQDWLDICAHVHDQVRSALAAGEPS